MDLTDKTGLQRRWKKRYFALGIVASYIIMCQSCVTMRSTPTQTRSFFTKAAVPYLDTTFVFDGHKLHYVATGEAGLPILLFVHGSPGSWDAFKEYMTDSTLLQRYRMVSVDRPGFGYSDFGRVMNLSDQAELIHRFIESIRGSAKVSLAGHSLGGPLILQIAALAPDRYDNLVVIAGSVDPAAEDAERWRPVIASFPFRYLIPGAMRPSNDELWLLKDDLYKLQPRLKTIRSNIVIVHGDNDSLVPFSNAAFIEAETSANADVELFAVKDAGHFILWTHFEMLRDLFADLK